jgi:hypothetical protein
MNRKILLWFDVEDYVTPESEQALYELLKMLKKSGVKATLKLCVKKYEQLLQHGRVDILDMMHDHEMSFHMTDHSVHPVATEYLDYMGFKQGAAEFDRREYPGFERLKTLCGQNLTSYGHPGVAWAPQVFPALRKWSVPTYLDVHDIVGINGQPFWYGGVMCYTKLNNLTHLVKDGTKGAMIADFENMNLDCTDTVFLSIYDHPHELKTTMFWDEVNFAKGKNPPYLTPSPLRTDEERDGLIEQYREFIDYTSAKDDTEYVTALESLRYEHQRSGKITASQIKQVAAAGDEANYAEIGGAYCTASEILNLMARFLTGRMLVPELYYGPEKDEKSVVTSKVNVQQLAEAVFSDHELVLGFKQLPSLYRVGDNFINPADAYATLARAIVTGAAELDVVPGRLKAADNVNMDYVFGGNWVLWADDFEPKNIFEQTKLQTWTLKPAIF